jgi:hypothetical protein
MERPELFTGFRHPHHAVGWPAIVPNKFTRLILIQAWLPQEDLSEDHVRQLRGLVEVMEGFCRWRRSSASELG